MRCFSACRGMYLELHGPGPHEPRTENTRGLSHRPAAAGTEEGQRSQPRCRSGSPATEPSGPGSSWTPRTTPSPTQLFTGPRGRTVANISPPGPSDRAAGLCGGDVYDWGGAQGWRDRSIC
jgi:hypothetical protein